MAEADDVFRIARSLEGTVEAPHFDRIAFRVVRTYATLAPDRRSINLKFTPDEQEFKCLLAPDAFSAIPNGWGRQGWTVAVLEMLSADELHGALRMAWEHGRVKASPGRRKPQTGGRKPK